MPVASWLALATMHLTSIASLPLAIDKSLLPDLPCLCTGTEHRSVHGSDCPTLFKSMHASQLAAPSCRNSSDLFPACCNRMNRAQSRQPSLVLCFYLTRRPFRTSCYGSAEPNHLLPSLCHTELQLCVGTSGLAAKCRGAFDRVDCSGAL